MSEIVRRKVVIDFELKLTPKTKRPTAESVRAVMDEFGLFAAIATLRKEAGRLLRLAEKNAAQKKTNGEMAKRFRAAKLERAAILLADIGKQIDMAAKAPNA